MDKHIKKKLVELAEKSVESIRSGKSEKSRANLRKQYLTQLKKLNSSSTRKKAIGFYNQTIKVLIQSSLN